VDQVLSRYGNYSPLLHLLRSLRLTAAGYGYLFIYLKRK
jgi:hypothetical protein